jgi:hypothetical protein
VTTRLSILEWILIMLIVWMAIDVLPNASKKYLGFEIDLLEPIESGEHEKVETVNKIQFPYHCVQGQLFKGEDPVAETAETGRCR